MINFWQDTIEKMLIVIWATGRLILYNLFCIKVIDNRVMNSKICWNRDFFDCLFTIKTENLIQNLKHKMTGQLPQLEFVSIKPFAFSSPLNHSQFHERIAADIFKMNRYNIRVNVEKNPFQHVWSVHWREIMPVNCPILFGRSCSGLEPWIFLINSWDYSR